MTIEQLVDEPLEALNFAACNSVLVDERLEPAPSRRLPRPQGHRRQNPLGSPPRPHVRFPPLAGHLAYAAWFGRCRWCSSHSVGVW